MFSGSIFEAPWQATVSAFNDLFGEFSFTLPYLFLILAGLALLAIARRIPYLRGLVTLGSWAAIIYLLVVVLQQQGMINPEFAGLAQRFNLDRQEVVGKEVRIKMARDGHFWARVKLNGVERRMLVDSGATITAISDETAQAASIAPPRRGLPVLIKTANGTVSARTGAVKELRLGTVRARNLAVVVTPALGGFDVLGMNFLSRLKSWRVEDNVLILVPHNPQPVA